jgi:hypothetical protein
MQKLRIFAFLSLCALLVSACIAKNPGPNAGATPLAAVTPTQPTSTAIPPAMTSPPVASPAPTTPAPPASITDCALLNTYDMASLFTQDRTETQLPKPQSGQVSHPIFSTDNAPGREITCMLYSFINPDVKDMRLLQINYWIDIPDPSKRSLWTQAWSQLKSGGGKEIPGLGQAAYFANGRLTLQQGEFYITIEAIGPAMNAVANAGGDPQLNVELLVAQDMLKKLG